MLTTQPRRSVHERTRLGEVTFERCVKPLLVPEQDGLFVAVDIDTGEYEIDENDYSAVTRLAKRIPSAEIFLIMAGRTTAYKFAGVR